MLGVLKTVKGDDIASLPLWSKSNLISTNNYSRGVSLSPRMQVQLCVKDAVLIVQILNAQYTL